MYAIIKAGGTEHKIKKGDQFVVDSMAKYTKVGDQYNFNEVLMVEKENQVKIGAPFVENAKVITEIKSHHKGKKIRIMKFKRRKSYLKRQGFRPLETCLEVVDIQD